MKGYCWAALSLYGQAASFGFSPSVVRVVVFIFPFSLLRTLGSVDDLHVGECFVVAAAVAAA